MAESEPPVQDVFGFLFISLLLGALVSYGLSRSNVGLPYTVVVFAVGVIISICFNFVHSKDTLKISIEIWDRIDPDLILFAFLPALLFGEAMSLNFHHVRGALVPSILLAGPGAVFGTFAIGCLAKYALPYDWSWGLCFVFGAILCATDPVAVVALLKKAGASRKLTYLIIGEALLNDGTALVLYNMLLSLVTIHDVVLLTPLNVFIYFLKVILISPLLGIAFGFLSFVCLSVANRRMEDEDTTIQMAITMCCAYLSFFVAEQIVEVSGVICCCSAGVFLAHFAPPLILHQHTIHSIWSAFEWIGNTLIFTLAGLIIGARSVLYIEGRDVAYIFVTYLFITIVRAAMMVLCYPILARIGKKYTVQEAVFVTWGGLRGAVSMALALSLSQLAASGETNIKSVDSHRVFILVGGTAALTLIINATLSDWVLTALKLIDTNTNEETHIMYHYVKKRIHKRATQLLESCSDVPVILTSSIHAASRNNEPVRYVCNKQLVYRYCSIFRFIGKDQEHHVNASPVKRIEIHHTDSVEEAFKDLPHRHLSFKAPHNPADDHRTNRSNTIISGKDRQAAFARARQNSILHNFYHPVTALDHRDAIEDLVTQVRRAFLEVVRVNYWKQINSGKLPRKSAATLALLSSIDVALETANEKGLQDWEALVKSNRELLSVSHASESSHSRKEDVGSAGSKRNREEAFFPYDEELGIELSKPKTVFDDMREAVEEENKAAVDVNSGSGSGRSAQNRRPFASVPTEASDRSNHSAGPSTRRTSLDFHHFTSFHELRARAASVVTMHDGHDTYSTTPVRGRPRTFLETISDTRLEYNIAKKVYMLTSFIEAHEYAQKKIPYYLGESEGIDTPEERLVVEESKQSVREAQLVLSQIDANVITLQVSKQVARWILHIQEDMIEEFQKEGILVEKDAGLLLHEVQHDLDALGNVEFSAVVYSKIIHKLRSLISDCCFGSEDDEGPLSPSIDEENEEAEEYLEESGQQVKEDADVRAPLDSEVMEVKVGEQAIVCDKSTD